MLTSCSAKTLTLFRSDFPARRVVAQASARSRAAPALTAWQSQYSRLCLPSAHGFACPAPVFTGFTKAVIGMQLKSSESLAHVTAMSGSIPFCSPPKSNPRTPRPRTLCSRNAIDLAVRKRPRSRAPAFAFAKRLNAYAVAVFFSLCWNREVKATRVSQARVSAFQGLGAARVWGV
eukprot:3112379-Rhodomonas_salina.1